MKQISYSDLSKRISDNAGLVKGLNFFDKAITYFTAVSYLLFLAYGLRLGINSYPHDFTIAYRSIIIPGVAFVIVSLYRKLVSSPRPYEVYGFVPALKKDTMGKSFPSRHVFSIFIVAFTYMQTSTALGLIFVFLGIALGIIRVVGGVHFIKDVIAGAVIAIITGFTGYIILGGVFSLCMLIF